MQKCAHLVDLEKCCQNAYFLANFRFDTAENEPAKSLQKFANFPTADLGGHVAQGPDAEIRQDVLLLRRAAAAHVEVRKLHHAARGGLVQDVLRLNLSAFGR